MEEIAKKVITATPAELLVITYKLTIDTLQKAIDSMNNSDKDNLKKNINKTKMYILELMNTLDMRYELSLDLMSIYIFINKIIIRGFIKLDIKNLKEAKKILTILEEGFIESAQKEGINQKPLIDNIQKVYTGLTYGKNKLNSTMRVTSNRGFIA